MDGGMQTEHWAAKRIRLQLSWPLHGSQLRQAGRASLSPEGNGTQADSIDMAAMRRAGPRKAGGGIELAGLKLGTQEGALSGRRVGR